MSSLSFFQLEPPWLRRAPAPRAVRAGWAGLRQVLALPFDLARHAHAAAVRSGALQRSMLESQRFERCVALVEQLTLGPLARRV